MQRWLSGGIAFVVVAGVLGGRHLTQLGWAPLHTRAMPGFDFDLPEGNITKEDQSYNNGRLIVGRLGGAKSFMTVTWQPGGLYSDDEVALETKALGVTLHQEEHTIAISPEISVPGHHEARSWAARSGSWTTYGTQILCGARRVTVDVAGEQWGVERLHRRIVASLRCRPDAVKESTVGEFPIAFDVGPGWFLAPNSSHDLQITNGRFVLIAHISKALGSLSEVKPVIEGFMPGFVFDELVGDEWSFHVTQDGESRRGWLTRSTCSAEDPVLIMSLAPPGAENEARQLLRRVRCRKPGEAPQKWPELPQADDEPPAH